MNKDLLRVVEAFAGLRVMVIGEAMLDAYVHGTVSRLCREAPVPIVAVTGQKAVPGGAANTAANVSNLGAHCEFCLCAGNDGDEDLLQRSLQERHVSTSYLVRFPTRRTRVKRRIVSASQICYVWMKGRQRRLRATLRPGGFPPHGCLQAMMSSSSPTIAMAFSPARHPRNCRMPGATPRLLVVRFQNVRAIPRNWRNNGQTNYGSDASIGCRSDDLWAKPGGLCGYARRASCTSLDRGRDSGCDGAIVLSAAIRPTALMPNHTGLARGRRRRYLSVRWHTVSCNRCTHPYCCGHRRQRRS